MTFFTILSLQLFIGSFVTLFFIARKNFFFFLLTAEMCYFSLGMLIVAYSIFSGSVGVQVMSILVITVSGCSSALGMVLLLSLKKRFNSIQISKLNNINVKL